MFHDEKLRELEEAQQLLVAQADVHRGVLLLETATLRERLGWIGGAREAVGSTSKYWLIPAAAGLGLAVIRYRMKLARWLPAALAVWRIARHFLKK